MDSPAAQPAHDDALSPAVNHAGGIARLMGDGALFGRVLARFRNEYRQAAAGIRDALDRGDTPLALRLVHTLKGAAGMIEAVPLRHQAHLLEQMLRNGGDGGDGGDGDGHGHPGLAVARLQDELERVLRELDLLAVSLAQRADPPAPLPAPSLVEQDGALERLVVLLDEGNGDAVDLVRDAALALAAQLGDAAYRAVADAIEAFDFDGALALLQTRGAGN